MDQVVVDRLAVVVVVWGPVVRTVSHHHSSSSSPRIIPQLVHRVVAMAPTTTKATVTVVAALPPAWDRMEQPGPIRTMGSCRVWSSAMVVHPVVVGILRIRGSIIMVHHLAMVAMEAITMAIPAMAVLVGTTTTMEVVVVRTAMVVACHPPTVPRLPCTVLRTALVHPPVATMVPMVAVLVECTVVVHRNKAAAAVVVVAVVVVLGIIRMVVAVEMVVVVIMHMVVVLLLLKVQVEAMEMVVV
mmetsp:Transcript_27260/g.42348  ORF Transcript_27260/g.42348 Transcript_27260/m.42348 type:complete len:243 (-) Transcript_27260:438-1166(-)